MLDFNINDTVLGKNTQVASKYDSSILFRIPRSENRIKYQLHDDSLPFVGFDVWNCYEFSYMLNNGLPICRVLKISYSAQSKYIVESKSLKLYLNSFNMECFGTDVESTEERLSKIIKQDLETLLETEVTLSILSATSKVLAPFSNHTYLDLIQLVGLEVVMNMNFEHFNESPALLNGEVSSQEHVTCFHTDVLRSNCRVTNQPDWGDLFVFIQCKYKINLASVLSYLISFRKENHFHEEVVEMIYQRLYSIFQPSKLMVAAMYTRRGGIDINPIRTSHHSLIESVFIDPSIRVEKTIRQ